MGGLQELLNLDRDWVPELEGTSLYIRPILFATDEYLGIRPSSRFRFMIITCPVGAYYSRPIKVSVETEYSRAAPGGTGFAKAAGNYAGSMYPAKLAQEKGYDQLLWTDAATHKYIEESGTMNVFFYINDILITPLAGDTILDGITRDSVLTIAREMGIDVEERPVSVDEVIDAAKSGDLKEAFGTGTAATVAPINGIGFKGVDYELVDEKPVAEKIKQTLDSIKTGKSKDRFNWTVRI
jgi:branched-chain amino acid aminotransferase